VLVDFERNTIVHHCAQQLGTFGGAKEEAGPVSNVVFTGTSRVGGHAGDQAAPRDDGKQLPAFVLAEGGDRFFILAHG